MRPRLAPQLPAELVVEVVAPGAPSLGARAAGPPPRADVAPSAAVLRPCPDARDTGRKTGLESVVVRGDPTATATLTPRTSPAHDRGDDLVLVVVSEGERREVPLPRHGELVLGRAEDADVCILHRTLSRHHVVIRVGDAVTLRDLGSKNGTKLRGEPIGRDVEVPLTPGDELVPGDIFEPGALVCFVKAPSRKAGPRRPPSRELPAARPTPRSSDEPREPPLLVDSSMRRIHALLERVAKGDINVLLLGETGVGKEVAARVVHTRSRRAEGPFLAVNCAALSASLLESELFGHEKGAFTGASTAKEGLFESAKGGTVFLDEVGELPLPVQATLLRVLEERTVTRVGSTRARPIDVRIVAATNRDLGAEVERGAYRRDLYFRLDGISVEIPPLRERRDEIAPLAEAFAKKAGKPGPLSSAVLGALLAWEWPGNVRELKNVMDRAVLLAGDDEIGVEHLRLRPAPEAREASPPSRLRAELDAIEKARIVEALDRSGGNQTRAAALLGMPRRTFILRLEAYGIPRPRLKPR